MTWQRAVVIGASGGIGGALCAELSARGTANVPLSRPQVDLTDEASIARAAAEAVKGGPVDLVIVASGILAPVGRGPEKALRDLDPAAMAEVLATNATGPLIVAKHFVPLLPRKGRSAFVALGARVGSIGDNRLGGWYSYRASKAALVMGIRTLAIEVARSRPEAICVALHPGTVVTRLSADFHSGVPEGTLLAPEQSAVRLLDTLERLGPDDSGSHIAWDGKAILP
ncbi:C-factor [Tsuneonella dongtanensis]|uniref:C-factor n=1 Tax=Tsuneonella dongtanensis TaxID=692370 RepID=A0A1B2AET1_9SPHN|nr:SDR family NAD(P)-dependent oxidoreductase [Tsuneonella dongtanensis]ANY20621.1 C-factor [Tsuneonella dongtanensis]